MNKQKPNTMLRLPKLDITKSGTIRLRSFGSSGGSFTSVTSGDLSVSTASTVVDQTCSTGTLFSHSLSLAITRSSLLAPHSTTLCACLFLGGRCSFTAPVHLRGTSEPIGRLAPAVSPSMASADTKANSQHTLHLQTFASLQDLMQWTMGTRTEENGSLKTAKRWPWML